MDNINQTSDSEYLGITEAADYLRVSASTLRRWEKKGFLVPERTPTGIRRYTKKQLDDVIQTPAYEKPAVGVAHTPAVQEPAPAVTTPITDDSFAEVTTPEPEQEEIDHYIHVVESDSGTYTAQEEINSHVQSATVDTTTSPPTPALNEESIVNDFESLKIIKNTPAPSYEEITSRSTFSELHGTGPNKTVSDNFATIEQQKFNHIFDIQQPIDQEDEVELDEYDSDAAYVDPTAQASRYSYQQNAPTQSEKKKRTQGWAKPVFLFISLFFAIIIISLVAWYAFSGGGSSGVPLNPVID